MPPPPSFIDITTDPFSRTVTQAEFNGGTFGGIANEVWFRYIAATTVVLGTFTDRSTSPAFKGDTFVYQSDGTTLVGSNTSAINRSKWFALSSVATYYIKITKHGGGATAFDFTSEFDAAPLDDFTVPPNAIVINDDADGFAATVYSSAGVLLGFRSAFPGGETAAALPTGETLWHDVFGALGPADDLALFTSGLVFDQSVDIGVTGGYAPRIAASETAFYVVTNGTRVVKITTAGALTDIATLPDTAFAFGVSRDGTIGYWTKAVGDVIYRHDLVNDIALSDLYSVNSNGGYLENTNIGNPAAIVTFADDSIVVFYHDGGSNDDVLVHISAAGALLHMHTFVTTETINHISRADTGSSLLNIWFIDATGGLARLVTFDFDSDSELSTTTYDQMSESVNLNANSPNSLGPSESCMMLTLLFSELQGGGGEEPPGEGGIIGPLAWVHWPRLVPGNPPGSP